MFPKRPNVDVTEIETIGGGELVAINNIRQDGFRWLFIDGKGNLLFGVLGFITVLTGKKQQYSAIQDGIGDNLGEVFTSTDSLAIDEIANPLAV